jgi:hypothetical protein
VADVGCGAVEVERGPDGVGVGTVACDVADGGTDGTGAVDNADVAWRGCEGLVEGPWFWALGLTGDILRMAACAAASRGVDGVPWSCEMGCSPSGGTR